MTAPRAMSECPTEEALAAFVDGRLEKSPRAAIIEHLASCADCRDLVMIATEARGDEEERPVADVVTGRFSRRFVTAAAALAVAATLLLLFFPMLSQRWFGQKDGIDRLVDASRTIALRPVEGRLGGGFDYHPAKPVTRGSATVEEDLGLMVAAREVEKFAAEKRTPDTLHAVGVSLLLREKPDEAVRMLESALTDSTHEADIVKALQQCTDATLLSDLAVAYLAQARATGSATATLRGSEASQRAWALKQTPETAWNRALALEKLSLRDDAANAWKDYLALDGGSPWAVEARSRLERLNRRTTSDAWESARPRVLAAANAARTAELDDLAGRFPEALREITEEEILVAASRRIVATGDAGTELRAAIAIGNALQRKTGDAFLLDAVTALERSASPAISAQGYLQFVEGRRQYRDSRIEPSMRTLEQAQAILARDGSPLAPMCTMLLASCEYYRNDYGRAVALTSAALRAADCPRHPALCALSQWVRGISHFSLGQMNEALAEYDAARQAFQRARYADGELAVLGLLASGYDVIGDRDRAWTLRLQTLEMLASIGRNSSRMPQTLAGAAAAAQRDGLIHTALVLTNREISATSDRKWADVRFAAYARKSELDQSRGDNAGAGQDLALAKVTAATIDDPALRAFATTHPEYVRAVRSATSDAGVRQNALRRALEFAERTHDESRTVALLLQLGAEQAGQGDSQQSEQTLESALAILDAQRERLSAFELRDHYLDERRDVYRNLAATIAARGEWDRALHFAERARARALRDMVDSRATPTASSAELRARIPDDTLVVYFLAGGDRLLVWLLNRRDTRFLTIAVPEETIAGLSNTILGDDVHRAQSAVQTLSASIVAPWESDALRYSTIVMIPDDELSDVPFAALTLGGRSILERARLEIAPSLSLFLRCLERDEALRTTHAPFLVVATPASTAEGRAYLPSAAAEAADVAASYGTDARFLNGPAATKNAILASAATAGAIHFAGHALFNDVHPSYAAIPVAASESGSMLYAHEIAASRFPSLRMVVLAACDGLHSASKQREGVSSLGRAFIAAGVPVVIGAIRPVDDEATAELFARFYGRLRAGADAATALRDAQLSLRGKGPISSWAAFQILGGAAEKKEV